MNRRERFRQAGAYALYYGSGKAVQLGGYPVAIVEPAGHQPDGLRSLQAAGTLVLAYVSVMEAAEYYEGFSLLNASDFLTASGGEVLRHAAFGTYMMDLRSKKWLGLLHHRIGQLFMRDGYDGLFLDTIGNVEMNEIPTVERSAQLQAAAEFVGSVRKLFPEHILVQNNGLNELCVQTAPWIDGICWENPDFTDRIAQPWTSRIVERLRSLCQTHRLQVMLLTERGTAEPSGGLEKSRLAKRAAENNGFLWYEAAANYLDILEP